MVAALRALLGEHGVTTASLSRGYGGRFKGPLRIDSEIHTASEVGDEPLMLAAKGETWIGRNKVETARAMCDGRQCVVLLDDGHQNPTLQKDLSLVVIDAAAPFGNGHVIPKGPLREPISRGLGRADGIVLMGTGQVPDEISASGLPSFRARLERTTPIPSGPLIAFAGIGRPDRFYEHLRQDGGDVRDTLSFADHHRYSRTELRRLHEWAIAHEATLVTTEKDFVRLPIEARPGITPIKVRAVFDDPKPLIDLILPHIKGSN